MSANNEHLTVITSSVASGESNAAKMVSTSSSGVNYGIATSGMNTTSVPTFSAQLLRSNEKIPPEIELKPVMVGVTQSSLIQSGPPTMTPTSAPHIAEVKKEDTVLTIPYDRERILIFLTDYWKSKNMQQVTEAQQQTAGVSGVASSDFCPAPQRIVEEALFDLFVEYPMVCYPEYSKYVKNIFIWHNHYWHGINIQYTKKTFTSFCSLFFTRLLMD